MVSGDQRLVYTPFVPSGYWSPCTLLVWNPVKVPDIRFSSSQFRKQHPWCENAPPTFRAFDLEDEYPEIPGRYSPSMHKDHAAHFNYKDRFRWSKRVPPYITGGIRYR
ncbi:unnamed protein product [Schistosoma margrebowiei]|uniref:Uncharacterized protein n=1 Tax=Schistosoma margrebowiei TaxID=48269 RepID=A0A183MTB4_9TREM|nr:unnamed protein product [Schistosoma margrebowiei]